MFNLTYTSNSCYWLERCRPLKYAVLLDSTFDQVQGKGASSPTTEPAPARRYDIISAAPETVITASNGTVTRYDCQTSASTVITGTVFDQLTALLAEYDNGIAPQDASLPFTGGLLGYWGYELNAELEPERIDRRTHNHPDLIVGLYLWAIIVDHQQQTTTLYCHPALSAAKKALILHALAQAETNQQDDFTLTSRFTGSTSRQRYDESFDKIQGWIKAGDCYQINLTQRFSATCQGDPWRAYRKLRTLSPTPFSAFLDYPQLKVLCHSPERLLLNDAGKIETKPIKGTRPRGDTPQQDRANAEDLLNSPKDRAENLMIVDLLRNDLGRNCRPGTVKVPVLFGLESYTNVHHMVSTITGELNDTSTSLTLLRDAFPGGSVTGAPKIRAMQIIREIEPTARAVYCGAIGYISFNGRMDTNIPIRTLVADEKQIHVWGGGAIVADSDCASEYEESITKIRNLVQGLESSFLERVAEPE